MNITTETTEFVKAHASPPTGMVFYKSLKSVQSDASLFGYVSVMERAWSEMDLDGALCLDGRPVLYLKEQDHPFSFPERAFQQRLFWNQGVANVLVLADPTSVYIYSGLAKPPHEHPDEEKRDLALVETLTYADYVQQIQSLYHSLATGHYYEIHRESFNPAQSVDSWLLDNLRALRNALIKDDEKFGTKNAHAFIGRVLFLCYLLDRGIISIGQPDRGRTGTMLLAKILERQSHDSGIEYLYKLFGDLRDQFNGNMFDQDLDAERHLIQSSQFRTLTLFLGGHDVGAGQRTMGFWPYDFKMIPVETISAIYQDFLEVEDREHQQKRGAYYTPRFLAEMVVDTAVHDKPDALGWSFLDPACGSGIFLVILFNRIASRWIHTQTGQIDYIVKAEALQEILNRQIRGVDIEETACRIACFSLYLAYLDFFDPPDIRAYRDRTGRSLPRLLYYRDGSNYLAADIPVIHRADFLSENTLSGETFDCIIGNPPWEGRQSKQLAQKFLEKAPRFLRSGGIGCLLLPSKILQNQTDSFQAEWLRRVSLEKILQLADYRRLLFQNALSPALIACFTNTPPHSTQHKVEFVAPKFNRAGLRQGVVTVNPSDRTWIPLSDILAATQSKTAPVVWKRRLWGTPRDQKLLDMLQSLPPLSDLAGTPKQSKRWIKGQGFQPNTSGKSKNPKSPWWHESDLYIDAKAPYWDSTCILLRYDDCEEISNRFQSLHRPRDQRIYRGPMVLVSQGFDKVAYCDFDVLFQDSLQSISGPPEDADLLMFLAAYLRSSLARYFLFHTAANWGTERPKAHLIELLRVPFPLPEDEFISPDAGEIVKQVAEKIFRLRDDLEDMRGRLETNAKHHPLRAKHRADIIGRWHQERKKRVDALQTEFDLLVYRYFGLTEQEVILVEDTIRIFEPSSTPTTWRSPQTVSLNPVERSTVEPYATEGLAAYANTLTETLNKWARAEGSSHRVSAQGGTDDETGLAMVTLNLSDSEASYQKRSLSRCLIETLKEFHARASRKRGTLLYEREIFLFQGEQIHIVRPNIILNWTRTAALNDAARIYGEIALAQEES